MGAALLLITIGGMLAYSAFTGTGMTDVLSGKAASKLNPKGGGNGPNFGGGGDFPTTNLPGTGKFPSGPQAALLRALTGVATGQFHLTITATTNGTHVPGSYHYSGEAFDASGAEGDMRGFAQYVEDNYGSNITELIHNPGFAIKNGQRVSGPVVYAAVWAGHRDHVHVAAAGTGGVSRAGHQG